LQLYQAGIGWSDGAPVTATRTRTPGNPLLKPERSREYEFGTDLGLLSNRVNIEWTRYRKSTQDALIQQSAGWDFGDLNYQENLGDVENSGTEVMITATVLQSRVASLDMTLNLSTNHNRLVRSAQITNDNFVSFNSKQRNVVGYPLYGYWGPRASYTDANNDGIIEPTEVSVADTNSYLGPSLPTREASLSTQLGLFGRLLRVNTLFDYRGGYLIYNREATRAFYGFLPEQNVPGSPLWLQARSITGQTGRASSLFERGTFMRFRELSVTYTVPTRMVRTHEVTLTGAVRNVALWTKYSGDDPEVSTPGGGSFTEDFVTGQIGVNNDFRQSNGAVPLPRSWVLRLNVGF
jgi:hypothetical protein